MLSFFPLDVLDEIWDLIESVSEVFPTYSLYIACNDSSAFFKSDAVRNYNLWSCQMVCGPLTFLLDSVYIRCDSNLYRQIVGIPMGTGCASLVADLL